MVKWDNPLAFKVRSNQKVSFLPTGISHKFQQLMDGSINLENSKDYIKGILE
jgi:hypothetical protein